MKLRKLALLALAAVLPVQALNNGQPENIAKVALTDFTRTQIQPGLALYTAGQHHQEDQYVLSGRLTSEQEAESLLVQVQPLLNRSARSELQALVENAGNIGTAWFDVGYRVVVNGISDRAMAKQVKEELAGLNADFSIRHLSSLPGQPANQQFSLLEIKPDKFSGSVQIKLAVDHVNGVATVSEIAANTSAVAAINGGFFVYNKALGVIGDPAGLVIIDGQLISEAVAHRPALLIQREPQLIFRVLPNVTTQLRLQAGDHSLAVNGINRAPGKVLNCGLYNGNMLVSPAHDTLCTSPDEVLVFTSAHGQLPESPPLATMAYINDAGQIKSVITFGESLLPPGHLLVMATGDKGGALTKFIERTTRATLQFNVFSNGEPVIIDAGTSLINGGPTLLLDGVPPLNRWQQEGWSPLPLTNGVLAEDEKDDIASGKSLKNERAVFFDGWVNKRHPRTGVGITPDGTAYFVVVYGRNPQRSAGLTVYELAQLLSALGATQAINLDGGGSSVMIVDRKVTGTPSDITGERAVADALLFLPPSKN